MTIVASTQVVEEGPRNLIMQFTGVCDSIEGGQETNIVKVDVTQTTPPCDFVRIERIDYDVGGGRVSLSWESNDPTPFVYLNPGTDQFRYDRAPLNNPKALGATGNLMLSTVGFEVGSTYTLLIEMKKKSVSLAKKAGL